MKVVWSLAAVESLRQIYWSLATYSQFAAYHAMRRIARRLRHVQDYPLSGRIVPEYESKKLREVIVGQFRIWYTVGDDSVEIIGVFHGARDLSRN